MDPPAYWANPEMDDFEVPWPPIHSEADRLLSHLRWHNYTGAVLDTNTHWYQLWVLGTDNAMKNYTCVTQIVLHGRLLSFCHDCIGSSSETERQQWLTCTADQLKLLLAAPIDVVDEAARRCAKSPCKHSRALTKVTHTTTGQLYTRANRKLRCSQAYHLPRYEAGTVSVSLIQSSCRCGVDRNKSSQRQGVTHLFPTAPPK